MAQYMITYLGGRQPATQAEGQAHFAKYRQWLNALGEAAISPANPLRNTHTVTSDGTVTEQGQTGMSGYTIIEAESHEAAIAIAQRCPFLEMDGSLEVSELMQMSG